MKNYEMAEEMFQYRKRYEVYCNLRDCELSKKFDGCFNTASGMRSIAILYFAGGLFKWGRFNTASGMRSIAIVIPRKIEAVWISFQYRKRYEVYCNRVFRIENQ